MLYYIKDGYTSKLSDTKSAQHLVLHDAIWQNFKADYITQ